MDNKKQSPCPTCGCRLYKEAGPCHGNYDQLKEFVDSLKEWCDQTTPVEVSGYGRTLFRRGVEKYADDLLKFAVQKLGLIKEGK